MLGEYFQKGLFEGTFELRTEGKKKGTRITKIWEKIIAKLKSTDGFIIITGMDNGSVKLEVRLYAGRKTTENLVSHLDYILSVLEGC